MNLLLFSDCYARTFGVSDHLLDYDFVFFDTLLELVQHDDGPLLNVFVLGPIDHIVFVFGEGGVEDLRGIIHDSLLDPDVLFIYVVQIPRSVIQKILQLRKLHINHVLDSFQGLHQIG